MTTTGKTILWIIIAIVIIGLIIGFTRTPKVDERAMNTEPIKIGFTGPLTGDLGNIGENAKAAVEIAVEEVNSSGGINGRMLEVIYEDDKCNGADGVKAANKLINVDGVSAILGSTCSPATLSFAPIAEQAKTPVLSYCSTAPKISEAGDYIFRDVPSDLFQADYAAKYLYNNQGKRKVAIININNDWGIGLRKAFADSFKALGGEIVLEESYESTSVDLRTQMAKVKSSKADTLYFPSFTNGAISGLKQAKALGLTQTIFGADAWDDNKIWEELGTAGEGAMYTLVGTNPNESFKTKMKEKLGNDSIIYCSNYAYDGVKVLASAMSKAGTDKVAIKDELYKVRYEGGVSSPLIEFDINGDPKGAIYGINAVSNGKAAPYNP